MAIGSTHRDPRSIIIPDAFDVSEDLLGTPLAPPIRRLLAWPIDFAVIGFVTLVTNSFSMILGLVVAVFFMRAGFKRTPVKGSVFGRAMRASVGCLGLFIGVITASSWALFGFGFGSSGDDEDDVSTPPGVVTDMAGLPFARGLAGLAAGAIFEGVDDLEDAEEAVEQFIRAAESLGVERSDVLDLVLAAVPEDASWADDAGAAFTRLVRTDGAERVAGGEDLDENEITSIEERVAAYSTAEALEAYASLLWDAPEEDASLARLAALADRLSDDIAADTIARLQDRTEDLAQDQARAEQRLVAAEQELEGSTNGGFMGLLRGLWDEDGFGSGGGCST
jgi:hypothetical protein